MSDNETTMRPTSDTITYWENKVSKLKAQVQDIEDNGEQVDPILKSLAQLMETAVHFHQYEIPHTDFEHVTRVMKVRIDLARPLIESYFSVKTVSIYGVGLYAPMEGMMFSENFRENSGFNRKGATFNISSVPEDIQNEYEFRLAVPASGGLFVPKKCGMTEWLNSTRQVEYFDLAI